MKLDAPTDESEIILAGSKFDWCYKDQCGRCPGKVQKFHFETQRRKQVIVYSDSWRRCPCKCHGKVVESVTKTRRRRRRKT